MNIPVKKSLQGLICSYPLAKKLKELGIMQRSYFYWTPGENNEILPIEGELLDMIQTAFPNEYDPVAAFSTDDLVRMLGSVACSIQLKDETYSHIIHFRDPYDQQLMSIEHESLPDALATLLIQLLEQRKKPVSEANQWLLVL